MSQKLLRSSDLDEPIGKAMAAGLAPVAKVFETLRDILTIVESIEAEDAGRLAAHKASINFRGGSHEQQR